MDAFSYLTVLLSIILGLSITQILQGLGALIQYRARIAFYWPAVCWAVLLLLIDVQVWWALFGLRVRQEWSFLDFLVLLLQVIPLCMLATLVLPAIAPDSDKPVNLRHNYYGHSRWFFGLLIASLAASIAKEWLLLGHWPEPFNFGFQLAWMVICAGSAVTRREWYHKAGVSLASISFVLYIAALFGRLR
jgi:hypothetical protein